MRPSTRIAAARALAMLLGAASTAAAACGVCVEDRVAAVYDHALTGRALAARHEIAYFSIGGPLRAGAATRSAVIASLEASGADPGSARVSLENAACSVAFDPARVSVAAIVAGAGRHLKSRGLALEPLRVIGIDGVLRDP